MVYFDWHHLRSYASRCGSKWDRLAQKTIQIDQIGTAPSRCFEISILRYLNFDIKYTKIVQNRSATTIDHQKIVIAKYFVTLFQKVRNHLFPQNVKFTQIISKCSK